MSDIFIYKSTGQYFGFIRNTRIYSRDGLYLGFLSGNFIWDSKGQFRGTLTPAGNHYYIFKNIFSIPPYSQTPKDAPNLLLTELPLPQPNINPIPLSVGYTDGF